MVRKVTRAPVKPQITSGEPKNSVGKFACEFCRVPSRNRHKFCPEIIRNGRPDKDAKGKPQGRDMVCACFAGDHKIYEEVK